MNKCAETFIPAIPEKYGCALLSRRLRKNSRMQCPPKTPGGRLIAWITISEMSIPPGRASKFGDAKIPASLNQPDVGSKFSVDTNSTLTRNVQAGAASTSENGCAAAS